MNFWGVLFTYMRTFWYIFPMFAVAFYYIMLQYFKKMTNMVLYIRKGGTMNYYKCEILGSHIKFSPEKDNVKTIHLREQPYLYSKGLNTNRIYVVMEGGGSTVKLSKKLDKFVEFDDAWLLGYARLPDAVRAIISEDKFGELSKGLVNDIADTNVGIGDIAVTSAAEQAASSAISVLQEVNEFIKSTLPKGKYAWMTMAAYLIVGYVGGITMGALFAKLGVI